MNIRVGLVEGREAVTVRLEGSFLGDDGRVFPSGAYSFTEPRHLSPRDPERARFAVPDVTIGIGFHWERRQEQVFRGALSLERDPRGLTLVNELSIEDYVGSVIASEMSAASPLDFLKAHAVISRSWAVAQIRASGTTGHFRRESRSDAGEPEILAWYGREAHTLFDLCADDHCQRYQGVAPVVGDDVRRAVLETASECLVYDRRVCDARFSKCCGGVTESFVTAWDGSEIPYLAPVADGDAAVSLPVGEAWITTSPPAWCNTSDPDLLERILPGFDRETTDFYRWQVIESAGSLGALVEEKTGHRIGPVVALEPLARGASGRLSRLRIRGRSGSLIVGKELEIRRVLSRSHLYSSAFVAEVRGEDIVLRGAGWGHGVGLCQIGAGRQAAAGRHYREILGHYYPGASIEPSAV